ncbi:MAG: hypothetical protein M3N13_03970 [Candidatus Eremiobacteraeota bacterium]|nr:hypothetical protein [Candidatus Eremiobacteraeota bacterium]
MGCSAGFFLDAGWDVWGAAPSSRLSDVARKRFGDLVASDNQPGDIALDSTGPTSDGKAIYFANYWLGRLPMT